MYHPAPAVKRKHFCHVKTHRRIAQAVYLQIALRGADETALLGPVHRFGRAGKGVLGPGLHLADDDGAVRFLHHHVQLPHPGAEVVGQQAAALLQVKLCGSGFALPAGLGAVHLPLSGQ